MTDAATDLAGGAGGVELPMFPLGSEAHRLGTALGALVDQKNQALEQTRRFIADASHELRTPLTTIVGYASLHEERRLDSGAATQDALDRIGQEGYRMQRIVDGLIQLALLDERPSLDVTPFDLGGLVNSVVNDFAITTTTHAFRTAAEAGHLTISSDQDRVRQVLVALVNNAAQHTPPGTTVTLVAVQHANCAVITVSDDGPGIEEQHLDRLFDRFYRVHRADGSGRRSGGLGLSIVRALVALLGGNISVDSTVAVGTSFRVEIPLDQRTA